MSYLTKDDLTTHIYSELLTEIVRGNDALVDKAISTAIAEVKSYLRKYDLPKLFSADVEDDNLKDKVKDVACWKLVKLANPNIEMNLFKELYDDAIKWFTGIMKGQCDPDGWPYKQVTQEPLTPGSSLITDENGNVISWSSNQKRRNHF
jgi:phage gp36-like protein